MTFPLVIVYLPFRFLLQQRTLSYNKYMYGAVEHGVSVIYTWTFVIQRFHQAV